jgi:hypothetical protein
LSATGTFTHDPSPISTAIGYPYSVPTQVVQVDIPLTCKAIYRFNVNAYTGKTTWPWSETEFVELSANPDIAGLGVSDVLELFIAKS